MWKSTPPCKVIAQVAFKAGGDVFYYLMANRPHHLAKVAPGKIHNLDLHQGDHGTNDAILQWKYTLDGKEQSCKLIIQDIDKEQKQIGYRVLEGDLLRVYKNMDITMHVETKGCVDFITWTIDYKLLDPDSQHPLSLLNFYIELTKEIETHIFGYRSLLRMASNEVDEANEDQLLPETKFKDESLVKILSKIESEFNTANLAAHNTATELKALSEELRNSVIAENDKTDKLSKELTQVCTTLTSLNSNVTKSISRENEIMQEAFLHVHQRLDHQSSRISQLEESMALQNEQLQSVIEHLQKIACKKCRSEDSKRGMGHGQRRRPRDRISPSKKKSPPLVGSTRGISRSLFGC